MMRVDLEQIKTDLNRYIDLVENGEVLILMRHEKEVAEVRPLEQKHPSSRPYGLCAGEFSVPDDFDALLPEDVITDFEGR